MKTQKNLIVYNTCGIKKDNTYEYPRYIKSLLAQKYKDGTDTKIIVSLCRPREDTVPHLKKVFADQDLDFLVINDPLPVNVTFNKAIRESVKKYGPFDNYVYTSADSLVDGENDMQTLFDGMLENPNYGMFSAQIDIDSCYAYGLKLGGGRHAIDDERARFEMFSDGTDYIVPVGRACAAHCQVYSSKIFDFYGNCCPDIFASYCTESIFSFVNAAIGLNWAISEKVLIRHAAGMDGASCATEPEKHKLDNPRTGSYDHAFGIDSLLPIFQNEKAKQLGLGYEECQGIVMHDPSQYKDNLCINDELKFYIKDNLYLTSDKFDYDKIDCAYV